MFSIGKHYYRCPSCDFPENCLGAWPLLLMKAGTRWITVSQSWPLCLGPLSIYWHGLPGLFQQSKDHKPDSKAYLKNCFSKVHFTDKTNCLHVQKLDEKKGEPTSFPSRPPPQLYFTVQPIVSPPTVSHSRWNIPLQSSSAVTSRFKCIISSLSNLTVFLHSLQQLLLSSRF